MDTIIPVSNKDYVIPADELSKVDNYNDLCRMTYIEESVIEEHLKEFDMDILCSCQHLSCEFMKKHYDKIHWSVASKTQILDDDLIYDLLHEHDKYTNRTIVRNLIRYQKMSNVNRSIAFSRLKKCVNFTGITSLLSSEIESNILYYDNYELDDGTVKSIPRKFSLEMIELLANDINWSFVSRHIELPEYFIRRYSKKVNWTNICRYQKLSEDFLVEFYEKLDWDYVWRYQNINESAISVLIDLDTVSSYKWENISHYQKLSEDFIRMYSDKLDWEDICIYQKLSESFIDEFSHKVRWDAVYKYQNISGSFINDHYEQFKNYID